MTHKFSSKLTETKTMEMYIYSMLNIFTSTTQLYTLLYIKYATSHYGKPLHTSSPSYDFQSLFRTSSGIVQSHADLM